MVKYADDVRKQLKAEGKKQMRLAGEMQDALRLRRKDTKMFERVLADGPQSPYFHLLDSLIQNETELRRRMTALQAQIADSQRVTIRLNKELASAPKRPRPRSKEASIAASGSKAINAEAKQRPPLAAAEIWGDGIEAAHKTACDRYDLGTIPCPSFELLNTRLATIFPTVVFVQHDGAYPVVSNLPRRSARQNS